MSDLPAVGAPTCYRHPGRETYVRCTRCNRPICPDCMREASVGHQCPECVAEGRRTQRQARTAFGGSHTAGQQGYVTKTLIAINVLVAIIGAAVSGSGALIGSGLFTGTSKIPALGGVIGPSFQMRPGGATSFDIVHLWPDATVYTGIADGGYYRLVTAMFIHYGLIHLLSNMWALWIAGRQLEADLGPARFLALYLICGLGGNVAAYVFQPGSLSAGASTAIFGLFAALVLVFRKLGRSVSAVIPVIVINLILTFSISGISIAGHLGGLVTGAIVGAGLAYAPRANRTIVQAGVTLGMLVLLGVLTLWQTSQLT